MISQPAQAGGRDVRCGLCRPFHGLDEFSHALTQGSASLQHPSGAAPLGTPLHPGLYASACSAGSLQGSTKVIVDRTWQNLVRKENKKLAVCYAEKIIPPTDCRLPLLLLTGTGSQLLQQLDS